MPEQSSSTRQGTTFSMHYRPKAFLQDHFFKQFVQHVVTIFLPDRVRLSTAAQYSDTFYSLLF